MAHYKDLRNGIKKFVIDNNFYWNKCQDWLKNEKNEKNEILENKILKSKISYSFVQRDEKNKLNNKLKFEINRDIYGKELSKIKNESKYNNKHYNIFSKFNENKSFQIKIDKRKNKSNFENKNPFIYL